MTRVSSGKLEPRPSGIWGEVTAAVRAQSRDHGGGLLSTLGSSNTGQSLSANLASSSGRRWSMAAQSVANQSLQSFQSNQMAAAAATATVLQPQQSVVTPSDSSVTPPSVAHFAAQIQASGAPPPSHETRRISFVIQDDNESITSSQTTLAVQVCWPFCATVPLKSRNLS